MTMKIRYAAPIFAASLAAGFALGYALDSTAAPLPTPTMTVTVTPEPTPAPSSTLPPCEYEDSDNCFWDAQSRGNGEGTSFVVLDNIVYYPED